MAEDTTLDRHFYVAPGLNAKKDEPCMRCGAPWADPVHIRPRPTAVIAPGPVAS